MENWEIALNKFVDEWKSKPEVTGMIVCGSYITWNPTSHSDIDIQIILKEGTTWRERGNEIIDGVLVEYFANPLVQNMKYYKEDYENRRKVNIHMYTTGKILFDKTWDLESIIEKAKDWNKKKYKKPGEIPTEIDKYFIWDMNDNLEEIADKQWEEFYMTYYVHLEKILEKYSKFLWFEHIPTHKIKRFLIDEKDKKKYNIDNFPDTNFLKMYVEAIKLQDIETMMKNYQQLTKYVLKKMWWFNIDGWKIRTELDL